MAHHNCNHEHDISHDIDKGQMNVLIFICILNFMLFILELGYGVYANSNALISDCLDNFSDSIAYLISLIALTKGIKFKTYAAMFKALLLLLLSIFVVYKIFDKFTYQSIPEFETMTYVSAISFSANLISVVLLFPYSKKDINMQSVWLCSRNDALANVFIFIAAILTWKLNSYIPDIVLAIILFTLFIQSSVQIFRLSFSNLKSIHNHE
ncbi:MAG: hypothetical protein RLZZ210_323 [Pseudomonadota bacterium]|jgi:Co/Zn/Cd efflux system component